MLPDKLTFNCPACGVRLTVPSSLAGVEGPCPTCTAPIRAPLLTDLPTRSLAAPELEPILSRPPIPVMPPVGEMLSAGPRIRPEPRELPERPIDARVAPLTPRKTTDDEALRRYPVQNQTRVRRSRPVSRMIVPLLFLAAAAVVVLGLVHSASNKRKAAAKPLPRIYPELATPRATEDSPLQEKKLAVQTPPLESSRIAPDLSASTTSSTSGRIVGDPSIPPPPSPDLLPLQAGRTDSPDKILEQFLQAKDAVTRLPLIEPQMTAEALAGTPLAGPLPEIAVVTPETSREVPTEGYTEYPFIVGLQQGGKVIDYSIVVRQRRHETPKVFVTPVLDLLGGRLAKYAATPDKEIATFHVILEAISGCYDHGVPDAENKFTFKLLPGPFAKDISRAYVSNLPTSRFRQMLDNPESNLRWGMRIRATVSLHWNQTEDPKRPFLEVLEIKALNWDS